MKSDGHKTLQQTWNSKFGQNCDSANHHSSADTATVHPIYISWKSIPFSLDKHIVESQEEKKQLRQSYHKKDYSEAEVFMLKIKGENWERDCRKSSWGTKSTIK